MSRRRDALRRANGQRLAAAGLRAELQALPRCEAAARVAAVLRDPDEAAGSLRLDALLLTIRRTGPAAVAEMFAVAGVQRMHRVGSVPPGQRERLARIVDAMERYDAGEGER